SAIAQLAIDRLLGLPPIDWSGEGAAKLKAGRKIAKEAEAKRTSVRRTGTKPSHALAEFAGEYDNAGYGRVTVRLAGDALSLRYNGIEAPLEHWHYDVFNGGKNATDPVFENAKLLFRTDFKGNVTSFEAVLEPATDPIVFKKLPDAKLSDATYLARFLGTYDLGTQKVAIGLKGNVLTATLPGQPTYDLVPDPGDELNL